MVYMREEISRQSRTRVDVADDPSLDNPEDEPRRFLSLKATGRVLGGITEPTIRKLVRQKHLQLVKIGHRSFITIRSIDAYAERLIDEADAASAAA